jgi:leader peptidase (prepilin peptidase) / N-methyltransferase
MEAPGDSTRKTNDLTRFTSASDADMLILAVIAFCLGACFGSFLGVVVHRLPRGGSIVSPGSRCEDCGIALAWYDNIPLVSWLVLGGRCRCCGAPIGVRAVLMELLTALITVTAALWIFFDSWQIGGLGQGTWMAWIWNDWALAVQFGLILLMAFYLWSSSLIDFDHMIIPDELVKPMQVLAPFIGMALLPRLLQNYYLWPVGDWFLTWRPEGFQVHLLSGALILLTVYVIAAVLLLLSLPLAKQIYSCFVPADQVWRPEDHRAFRIGLLWFLISLLPAVAVVLIAALWSGEALGHVRIWCCLGLSRAILGSLAGWLAPYLIGLLGTMAFRRNAMGYGDVKFLAPIGAVVGPIGVIYTVFGAALVGTLIGVPLRLLGRGPEIPFGPYLALGAVFAACFGAWANQLVAQALFPY